MKGKLGSFFQQIDLFLFSKVAQFENSLIYGQYKIFIKEHFEESIQKIINRILTVLLLLFPLIITFILLLMVWSQEGHLQTLKQINTSIQNISQKKKELTQIKNMLGQIASVRSASQLSSKLKDILRKYNTTSAKIKIDNFNQNPLGELEKIKADIQITPLSTEGFLNLIKDLSNRYKVFITKLEVIRDKKKEHLTVNFSIEFFASVMESK